MATTFLVGDLVQMRVWASDAEQAAVNTVWYKVAAVGSPAATDQDLADQFGPFLAPLYISILNNNAMYNGVQVQIYQSAVPFHAAQASVFNNASAGPGTAGAVSLPRQTCGLGSFQTARPGVKFRGRVYFPFPAAADDAGDGTPSSSYLGIIVGIANDLGIGISVVGGSRTATLVRVLFHRKDKDGVQIDPTPVVSSSVANKWATQRRRGSFGRANVSPI